MIPTKGVIKIVELVNQLCDVHITPLVEGVDTYMHTNTHEYRLLDK